MTRQRTLKTRLQAVYVVLNENRHIRTELFAFAQQVEALKFAHTLAGTHVQDPADVQSQVVQGVLLWLKYSREGDHVSVHEVAVR